jgi:hypothetical protein
LFFWIAVFVAGIAENNELAQDYRDHLKKYVPALRSYGLNDAAQYYEDWVEGVLELAPLLDVAARLSAE